MNPEITRFTKLGKTAKLSTKGQVTVPVAARHKFNLETGDPILFLEEDGKLVLRKG